MIKSMTGYGRFEYEEEGRKITVEIKSVNHRYLDLTIKMPKKLSSYEASIRMMLKKYIQRGKVDLFITYEDYSEQKGSLSYNEDLAREYLNYFKRMEETFQLKNDISVAQLSRYPDVLVMEEQSVDEKKIWSFVEKAIEGAVLGFVQTRIVEGENLKNDLLLKLESMLGMTEEIEKKAPEIIEEYKKKLVNKVQELLEDSQIDDSRIATEVTLFADKICTDEEVVRLKSHIMHMKTTLETEESIGRKLDFIAQEMNREANTILSKANNLDISNTAIDLKTEIEKVREQIQNIE